MNTMVKQVAGIEDVSVVMAVYNHESTIVEALESALMQKMPYSSVIYCFNDASTDRSGEILDKYAKKYPGKIRVFTSLSNQGSGKKSFLYHQPHINGRYWCMLAGDDYWTSSEKLARQIALLDKCSEYVGCSSNTIMKNEVTGEDSIIKPDRNSWNLLDLIMLERRYAFYVHPSSIVWRNVYLDKGFFLPPNFKKDYAFGDVILMHMMLGRGGEIINIPEVMSCYRITGSGIWTGKSEKEQALLTEKLKKGIEKCIPLRYKFYAFIHKRLGGSSRISKFVPGPVNK